MLPSDVHGGHHRVVENLGQPTWDGGSSWRWPLWGLLKVYGSHRKFKVKTIGPLHAGPLEVHGGHHGAS
jgi:hypothetical protein